MSAIERGVRGLFVQQLVKLAWALEVLAQEDGAGALAYFQVDGLGSIVKTTNGAGAVTATRRYERVVGKPCLRRARGSGSSRAPRGSRAREVRWCAPPTGDLQIHLVP